MTLSEAIEHCEEVAVRYDCLCNAGQSDDVITHAGKCANEHRQLAEWLRELKELKDKIVHCRDCAWWVKQIDSMQGRCVLHQTYPTGAYFCGSAERKHDDRQE